MDELDWSVGEILDALRINGLDKNTFVIFTSDNGPGVGSAEPLRDRKGSTYEGGMRVPAIVWWPGKIPPQFTSSELITSMDLLPTISFLAGADIPIDRVIDGRNIWPILSKQVSAHSPHERFYYYKQNKLMAVRSGDWKLHRLKIDSLELYNLKDDQSEKINVAKQYPQIVQRLLSFMNKFDNELNDVNNIRKPGEIKK
jgi:arylsulfatase A-like enzyme